MRAATIMYIYNMLQEKLKQTNLDKDIAQKEVKTAKEGAVEKYGDDYIQAVQPYEDKVKKAIDMYIAAKEAFKEFSERDW